MSTSPTGRHHESTPTARTALRALTALVTAALVAGAVHFAELELLTAAMLVAVAGIAVDVRLTARLARVRVRP
ncbi:hypothetical protein [Kocuria flava]|nr:hypothetical protein [Kocuria flava]